MSNSSNLPVSSCSGERIVGFSDFMASDRSAPQMTISDPFVAQQDQLRPAPKPVEEILRNLNGYRIIESPNPKSKIDLAPTAQLESASPGNQIVDPARAVKQLKVELVAVSPQFTVTSVQRLKLNSASGQPSMDLKLTEIPLVDLRKANSVQATKSNEEVTDVDTEWTNSAKRFLSNEDPADLPILVDIRDFAPVEVPAQEVPLAEWEPIPGAFQYDPDFFELHAPQRHLNQLEALDQELTHVISARPSKDPQVAVDTGRVLLPQTPVESQADSNDSESDEFGVIYAKDQQIIFVDGNEGFEFIDLSCFAIEQASFQANRIRIQTEQQVFEVDYRNVTHVLFAKGQEVELACEEEYD